jgi:hypothetical protein
VERMREVGMERVRGPDKGRKTGVGWYLGRQGWGS